MVQSRCDVYLHSTLDRASVEFAHLRHAPDPDETLSALLRAKGEALGRDPTVCVMPYGQFTVPRLEYHRRVC
jgi:hypothetical protein